MDTDKRVCQTACKKRGAKKKRKEKQDRTRSARVRFLLLGVGSLLLLLSNAGLDLASGTVGAPSLAKGLVSVELLLLGSDSPGLLGLDTSGQRENSLDLTNGLNVGEVDLLVLVLLVDLGDHHETCLVSLDALDVELEALLRLVAATVVHGDADRTGVLLAQAGSLDLLNGEATTRADLGVVSERGASDGGAERLDGSETELGRLGLTSGASPLLGSGLVEPDLDPTLPVLAEVVVVKDVVVLHGHLLRARTTRRARW